MKDAIRTKYVCASGWKSYLIAREGLPCLGFSHAAALLSDGTLLDSRDDLQPCLDGVKRTGVQNRPDNYTKWIRAAVVEIRCGAALAQAWEEFLRARIGDPYDQDAIKGFILGRPLHKKGHYICSALQFAAKHHVGVLQDGHKAVIKSSQISPDLLFGMDLAVGGQVVERYGF